MTDLEAHVAQPGRDDLIRQVREKINELGITYIYYQFISVTGRIVGKGIPADHWERTAERGFQLVYGSTANLLSTGMEITSGTVPSRWNWSAFLIQTRSVSCPGISGSRACFVCVSGTGKNVKTRAWPCPPIVEAISNVSTPSSRKSTTWISGAGQNRK